MGSDLNQWRCSIGMFNLKSIRINCKRENSNNLSECFSQNNLFPSFSCLPLKLIFGTILVFVYSLMVITSLSIFMVAYPFLDFLCLFTKSSHQFSTISGYLLKVFIHLNCIPYHLITSVKRLFLLYNYLPEKIKNICFFVFCFANAFVDIWDRRN